MRFKFAGKTPNTLVVLGCRNIKPMQTTTENMWLQQMKSCPFSPNRMENVCVCMCDVKLNIVLVDCQLKMYWWLEIETANIDHIQNYVETGAHGIAHRMEMNYDKSRKVWISSIVCLKYLANLVKIQTKCNRLQCFPSRTCALRICICVKLCVSLCCVRKTSSIEFVKPLYTMKHIAYGTL